MTYSREAVYTYVRNALVASDSSVYVTARREPVPKSFPCVRLSEMNRTRPQQYATLANDDNQYSSTFEVEIFSNLSNGALAEAYSLLKIAEDSFKQLGYFEVFCEALDNVDPSVFRIIGRFTKQIGEADVIPTPPSNTTPTEQTP